MCYVGMSVERLMCVVTTTRCRLGCVDSLRLLQSSYPSVAHLLQHMADAIKEQVLGSAHQAEAEANAARRVGFRKRAARWAAAAAQSVGGGGQRVPDERALVPVAVRSEPWRRG